MYHGEGSTKGFFLVVCICMGKLVRMGDNGSRLGGSIDGMVSSEPGSFVIGSRLALSRSSAGYLVVG